MVKQRSGSPSVIVCLSLMLSLKRFILAVFYVVLLGVESTVNRFL